MAAAPKLVRARPAETSGIAAGAVAGLAGHVFGWDATTIGYVAILVGFVPAVVTWIVVQVRGDGP